MAHPTFLGQFHHKKLVASTVPGNGDINPYGVAVVRHSQGRLQAGDILVSNFNDAKNEQGTGSTIVEISPSGHRTPFARISPAGLPPSWSRRPGSGLAATASSTLPTPARTGSR
jgi:hypothetical protein